MNTKHGRRVFASLVFRGRDKALELMLQVGTTTMVLANIWKQGVQKEVSYTFACPKCGTKYILLIKLTLYIYRFCFLRPVTALCVL